MYIVDYWKQETNSREVTAYRQIMSESLDEAVHDIELISNASGYVYEYQINNARVYQLCEHCTDNQETLIIYSDGDLVTHTVYPNGKKVLK